MVLGDKLGEGWKVSVLEDIFRVTTSVNIQSKICEYIYKMYKILNVTPFQLRGRLLSEFLKYLYLKHLLKCSVM